MNPVKNKNLLVVSYYLPPIKTVGTLRIYNFHNEANKHFAETYSLTTKNRHFFPKENYNFDDSKTTEIDTWDLRGVFSKNRDSSVTLNPSSKRSRWIRFFIRLSYSFPFNLLLADGGLSYILGGFFKAKKIVRAKNIEYLFSSYHPHADHLICFLLKIWNPRLFWIADFRDLPVDEFRKNVVFPFFQGWCNRLMLKKADIVTTVSNGLAKHLTKYHSNVYVLKNGISEMHRTQKNAKAFEKFTICYTGSLYPDFQSANIFFKIISELVNLNRIDPNKIQLIYAGKDSAIWGKWINNYELDNMSIIHGSLPLEQSKELQHKSHLNLLLSWSSSNLGGILTAKFYEYIAAGNPILTIINGTKDTEFEKIFASLSAGLVTYESESEAKKIELFLLNLYKKWEAGNPVRNYILSDKADSFYWDKMMEKFIKFLSRSDTLEKYKPKNEPTL